MLPHPVEQQTAQPGELESGDRFEGAAVAEPAPGLHLDGDDAAVVVHHQIELAATARSPIAIEHLAAEGLQIFGGQVFSLGAEGVVLPRRASALCLSHTASFARLRGRRRALPESVDSSANSQQTRACGKQTAREFS